MDVPFEVRRTIALCSYRVRKLVLEELFKRRHSEKGTDHLLEKVPLS